MDLWNLVLLKYRGRIIGALILLLVWTSASAQERTDILRDTLPAAVKTDVRQGEEHLPGVYRTDMAALRGKVLSPVGENDPIKFAMTRPGSPWNTCFPYDGNGNRCSTSSSVVATAQLAYYHHYYSGKPLAAYEYGTCTSILNQTSDLQLFNLSSSNWGIMPLDSSSSSSSGKQAVAALMAQIGQETGTLYSPNGTLTLITNSLSYLSYIGLSYSGFINYSNNELQVLYDLQHNWPVYVVFHNSLGSHYDAVIDGIMVYAERETYYYQWMPIGTYPPVEPEYPDLEHPELYEIYDHWGDYISFWYLINWGMDGLFDDGEYSLSNLTSVAPPLYYPRTSIVMFYNIH